MSTDHPGEGRCANAKCHCEQRGQRIACQHFTIAFPFDQPLISYAASIVCRKAGPEGDQLMHWVDFVEAPDAQWAQAVAINQGLKHLKGGTGYQASVAPIPEKGTS
jgi:hypothetical protein